MRRVWIIRYMNVQCVQVQLTTNITLIDELNQPPVTKRDWLLYNITRDFAPCTNQQVIKV